jgi:HlyD family secretion protein
MIALDLTKMQVYAKTDEGDVGQIGPGQKVDFQVDAFPKEMFHGVVFQVRMNATSIQNVVTYDTIVNFDNPELKLFPGMTAYVSIPVAAVNDVIEIPNAALRYKPDLSAEKVQELYGKYGVAAAASTPTAPVANQQSATGREHAVPKPSSTGSSGLAVVWKLLADKSLRPVQIHIGLTDHTYTALTAGDLQPGEELVTGSSTVKQESSGPGLTPQRR